MAVLINDRVQDMSCDDHDYDDDYAHDRDHD